MKPNIVIHNLETNEIIEREMTDEEFDVYTKDLKRMKDQAKEYESKIQARKSALDKLAALGLTEEEIAAL